MTGRRPAPTRPRRTSEACWVDAACWIGPFAPRPTRPTRGSGARAARGPVPRRAANGPRRPGRRVGLPVRSQLVVHRDPPASDEAGIIVRSGRRRSQVADVPRVESEDILLHRGASQQAFHHPGCPHPAAGASGPAGNLVIRHSGDGLRRSEPPADPTHRGSQRDVVIPVLAERDERLPEGPATTARPGIGDPGRARPGRSRPPGLRTRSRP